MGGAGGRGRGGGGGREEGGGRQVGSQLMSDSMDLGQPKLRVVWAFTLDRTSHVKSLEMCGV